jgi:hypothetical protein
MAVHEKRLSRRSGIMKEILNKTTCEEPEPELTYKDAIKPFECKIKALTVEIMKAFEESKLNCWAQLETLDRVKMKVEDSLGTMVNPGLVNVEKEDQRLENLSWQIYENQRIAEQVSFVINSTGYKLRNYTEDQLWEIVKEYGLYW